MNSLVSCVFVYTDRYASCQRDKCLHRYFSSAYSLSLVGKQLQKIMIPDPRMDRFSEIDHTQ